MKSLSVQDFIVMRWWRLKVNILTLFLKLTCKLRLRKIDCYIIGCVCVFIILQRNLDHSTLANMIS